MSSEATAPHPALSSGTDGTAEALIAVSAEVLAEIRGFRRDLARARAEGGELLWAALVDARLADGFGIYRDGIGKIRDAAQFRTAADIIAVTRPALEAVPEPRRPRSHRRHRIPRQRTPGDGQIPLWSVKGMVAFVAAAKPAAVIAAAAGIIVTGAGAGVIARAVLSHPDAPAAVPVTASASAPGWGTLVPGPASSLIALTKPRARQDAATAGVLDPDPAPTPAASSPASSQVPSASPSPAQPSATVQGQLQVSAVRLDFGLAATETLTLTARLGPVTWTAATDSADVALDSYGGTIPANGSVTVTVSVNPLDTLTQAKVTFAVGGYAVSVRVTWALPPLPSVLPSPLASISSSP